MNKVRLCVLGDGGFGKTASTIQFVANHFDDIETLDPTIEDSYKRHMEVDETQFLVDILDTAGEDHFSPLRECWIRESEGFLLIYSVTNRGSLEHLEGILAEIEHTRGGCESVPIVLIGNKCDLADCRTVSVEEGEAWAKTHGIDTFVECSAKTRHNVPETFESIVRSVGQAKGLFDEQPSKKNQQGCIMF